jgi:hypothetical protein
MSEGEIIDQLKQDFKPDKKTDINSDYAFFKTRLRIHEAASEFPFFESYVDTGDDEDFFNTVKAWFKKYFPQKKAQK